MSANDKKSEVFSYVNWVKCEFLAKSHTASLNKGFQTNLRICVNANVCVFEWTHASRLFYALYVVCLGSTLSWNRQDCNRWSAKHLAICDWSVFKCSDTNVVFQTVIFMILVLRNTKRSSSIDGKTSDCFSRICLYYPYLELRFW